MDYLQEAYPVSGARACGLLHLAVSSYYYHPHGRRDDLPVREALRRHAAFAVSVGRFSATIVTTVQLHHPKPFPRPLRPVADDRCSVRLLPDWRAGDLKLPCIHKRYLEKHDPESSSEQTAPLLTGRHTTAGSRSATRRNYTGTYTDLYDCHEGKKITSTDA